MYNVKLIIDNSFTIYWKRKIIIEYIYCRYSITDINIFVLIIVFPNTNGENLYKMMFKFGNKANCIYRKCGRTSFKSWWASVFIYVRTKEHTGEHIRVSERQHVFKDCWLYYGTYTPLTPQPCFHPSTKQSAHTHVALSHYWFFFVF